MDHEDEDRLGDPGEGKSPWRAPELTDIDYEMTEASQTGSGSADTAVYSS